MLKVLIKHLFANAFIVSALSLGFALSISLPAFAFLGMNAGATLQGPLPAWTKQLGAFQTAKAPTYGKAVATDTSGNIFVAGYAAAGVDGNARAGVQDFFVTKYDSSGTKLWTRQMGVATKITSAYGVATDSSGNVYVAGNTSGGLDGNTLTGTQDFFVTKYDSSGTKQWTKQLGIAAKSVYASAVATDSSGNVFVAGTAYGGLDGNTMTGSTDFFVTKYDSSGTKLWTRQLGVASTSTSGEGVTTDSSGNVFVTGYTAGGLDGNTLTGNQDFFVTKYDSSGTKLWTRQLGVASTDTYGNAVASDSSGNVFVAGNTYGALDGNSLTGFPDLFVTKYNSTGTKQWTRLLGAGGASTVANGVAADSTGNVYVAGDTSGGLNGNTLTGTQDSVVTKYDPSGTKQWTKQLGVASKLTSGSGVVIDSSGNIFVAGYTQGGLDSNTLTGTADSFVVKYDNTGAKQWTTQLGGLGGTTLGNISSAKDASGNLYVAGTTDGGIDGNTQTGTIDSFFTKFDSSGAKLWTKQFGIASKSVYSTAAATDLSGNLFIAGYTDGGLDGNSLTGTQDFFVTKYDTAGTRQWTRQLGVASKNTFGYGVATDSSGNVFVAGSTNGGLDGNTLTGTLDFFVTKYDSSGSKLWTMQLGVASKNTNGTGVATDSSGNVFVAGYTNGGLDGNSATGIPDLFITKYDASGAKLWTKQLGSASKMVTGNAVTTDSFGNVFAAGYTNGSIDGNTYRGVYDLFVTKYDSTGVKQWTRQMGVGNPRPTMANALATDLFGNVFVVGQASGALDGNKAMGITDLFIAKYTAAGVKQWTKQLGTSVKSTIAKSAVLDSSGRLYVAGTTTGGLDFNSLNGSTDAFVCQYVGN